MNKTARAPDAVRLREAMTAGPENGEPAPTPLAELADMARISMFAALVGAGAFIHIPLGPAHISLQTMMVMLTGFVLGPKKALLAMLVYLACGFIGLPMFGRGKAGPASFLGPTAGFLPGFVVGAATAGLSAYFTRSGRQHLLAMIGFGLAGTVLLLLLGTAGLRVVLTGDWSKAFALGFAPYIAGDVVKMLAAAAVRQKFFPPGNGGRGADHG